MKKKLKIYTHKNHNWYLKNNVLGMGIIDFSTNPHRFLITLIYI